MINTSALYKSIRETPGYHYNVNVICDDTEEIYGMDRLMSVRITPMLFAENGPSIGNACSAECYITLIEQSENWPRMAKFTVKVQVMSEDNTQASEWLTLGTFITDERFHTVDGNLSISGFDAMLTMEIGWVDAITAPSSWPITAKEWCDLIEAAGLAEFDDRNSINSRIAFIGLDTTSTIRDKLKDIASAHGGNWVMTGDGKLRLVPFTNTIVEGNSAIAGIAIAGVAVVGVTDPTGGWNYQDVGMEMRTFSYSTPLDAVTGVDLETESGLVSYAGTNSGYVVRGVCNFSNTDSVADYCLQNISGYIYRGFSAETVFLDPACEVGDLILYDDVGYQMMTITWNINHMPTANVSAPYEEEVDHEYVIDSNEVKTYRKIVSETVANNLIPYPYSYNSWGSSQGVTMVLNDDGSLTLNGTSTGAFENFIIASTKKLNLGSGTYTLSIGNGSDDTAVSLYKSNGTTLIAEAGSIPVTFAISNDENNVCVSIKCRRSGVVYNNLKVYPQIERGALAHDWQSPVASFSSRIIQNADNITLEVTRAEGAEDALSSRITQNAGQIALKVSKGDVASQLTVECTDGTGYVNVGTDRFTVDSTNFKLDRNGNVNAFGTLTSTLSDYKTSISGGLVRFYYANNLTTTLFGGNQNISGGGVVTGLLFNQSLSGANGVFYSCDAKNKGQSSSIMINNGISQYLSYPDLPLTTVGAYIGQLYSSGLRIGSPEDIIADTTKILVAYAEGYLPNNPNHTGNGVYLGITGDGLAISGGLYVYGTKNRVVKTKHFGDVGLNAVESTDAVFTDFGAGTVDESGMCYVFFDPVFAETISNKAEYYVFTTKTSVGNIDWIEKKEDHFIVHGSSSTSFDWIVYAKQLGYEDIRMETVNIDEAKETEEDIFQPPIEDRYDEPKRTMSYMEELEPDYDKMAEDYLNLYNEEIENYV